MAILRSMDGRFYQVPDEELAQHVIPADKLIETMRAAGYCVPATGVQSVAPTAGMVMAYHGPPGPPGPGPGPHGPGPGPGFGPPLPFFGPPAPPPVYFNYQDYRNFWGGW
ncbi:MAG: hypothetical protein N2689_10180 [Verrucomicrobiae bacterium]|nr:hypothetical protein [Verrucomicrobiae bacterium]